MKKINKGWGGFIPEQVIRSTQGAHRQLPDGRWVLARPEPYYSRIERLRQAWHVFTYKADALYWDNQ